MFFTGILLSAASVVILGTLLTLCGRCRCSKKKHVKRIDKHDMRYNFNEKQLIINPSRRVEIHHTAEDQIKNTETSPTTDYRKDPSYENVLISCQNTEGSYVNPISTNYYNYDFGATSSYSNVFISRCAQKEPDSEMSIYENIFIERCNRERSGSENDYIFPDMSS